jgi:hypothetical protein
MKKKKQKRLGGILTVAKSFAEAEAQDCEFWHKQTPNACLRHLQFLRRLNYGKAADGPMVKVLEIVSKSGRVRRIEATK